MRKALAAILVGLGLVLIGVSLLAFSGSDEVDTTEGDGISVAPEQGALAPNFTLETVYGDTVQLSDFQGKVILLNFWAVWCPPCLEEMPSIQKVHERFGDQLVVLAVNAGDSREDALSFRETYRLSFETLLDSENKVESQYRVRGLPTTFFIDEQGIIQITHIGFMEESQLAGYLTEMGVTE
jgi:thiol-disulfide isomerase/thioredoxin